MKMHWNTWKTGVLVTLSIEPKWHDFARGPIMIRNGQSLSHDEGISKLSRMRGDQNNIKGQPKDNENIE